MTDCAGPYCVNTVDVPDRVCVDCWAYRVMILGRLPHLLTAARTYLPPRFRPTERVSGGRGPASRPPLRNSVMEAVDSVTQMLKAWAELCHERANCADI